MNRKDITIGVVGLVLTATAVSGFTGWYLEHRHATELESQLDEARLQEKRSAVDRSISKQMEEIAYQQREISDEQREEAIQQKRTADEMRQRSEIERQNALKAQQQAVASEVKAQEARQVAENERQIAEHQRIQAELSKRMTDTLSYVALARSLGSLSLIQSQLGNNELADLLAYSSYLYINRYKDDVYHPAIFQSLMASSQSKRAWSEHNGILSGIAEMSKESNTIATCSTYGELMVHKRNGDHLQSKTLLSNPTYDFRDILVDEEVIYAISRNGHLAIIANGTTQILDLSKLTHPSAISEMDKDNLLLIGDHGIAQYNKKKKMITAYKELDFKVISSSRYDYKPLLFDDQGRQHQVQDINKLVTTNIPVHGKVTAFASSKNTKQRVYGMSDGTIYLFDEKSGKISKLDGHLSRISKLKMNGTKLYSASYDGTMKLWNTNSDKIEPMTLITTGSWIMNFIFDGSKQYVWMGDQNGVLTMALISVPMMVDRISSKLKRDFTVEEWNYYIGRKIPFESFMSQKGKEAKQ